jgi:hypothetical protein
MIPSARYVLAFIVNVVLPAAAYRIAFPHYGLINALIASTLPLLVWIAIDLLRFRHFDALSALVLAGIVMSLLVLVSGSAPWLREAREPMVSGIIGMFFLLSLATDRPLVFYLARSTLSRERSGREREFDMMWQTRPTLVRSIRLMTVVWGVGLVGETVVRLSITCCMVDQNAHWVSTFVSYATYAGLTAWTIAYRRLYIKRQQA